MRPRILCHGGVGAPSHLGQHGFRRECQLQCILRRLLVRFQGVVRSCPGFIQVVGLPLACRR